jgi:hypothetical protein
MKTSVRPLAGLVISLALVLAAVVSVPSVAHAQSLLRAKIPFEFIVGEQQFAPGNYTVLVTPAYIKVSDEDGHSRFVITNSLTKPALNRVRGGMLVFTRYDNSYFLSEVWREGYSSGNAVNKTSLEARIARNSSTKEPIALRAAE